MLDNVLVIGSGGRECAIAYKLILSPKVSHVYVAPGNAGTELTGSISNLPIAVDDFDEILAAVKKYNIKLVIVGPEVPLIAGLADMLRSHGVKVFGPGAQGALLEGSKAFAKQLMLDFGIPTAPAVIATSYEQALAAIKTASLPIVIKADGPAAGKGVVICKSRKKARNTVRDFMVSKTLGESGSTVLIEQCLEGKEASLHFAFDGRSVRLFPTSRDFKREFEGDKGRNTGGMGAYAPLEDESWVPGAMKTIIGPLVRGLKLRKIPYRGEIYVGIMLTKDGPMVLEFNCRFGDPETQVMLPLLRSDFYELCLATATRTLSSTPPIECYPGYALAVVFTARGYPGRYKTGEPISGLNDHIPDTCVILAGAKRAGKDIETNGGRVGATVGRGLTLERARKLAYKRLRKIYFKKMGSRADIARRD